MSTETHLPVPGDGRAEIRVMSTDREAAQQVWDATTSALGHHAAPIHRAAPGTDGVCLSGVVTSPDRPLPGQQDAAEASTAHLSAGKQITVDELAVHCSAVAVWVDQLARAAEAPATPVELADDIDSLRREAAALRDHAKRMQRVARIIDGDVPLALGFMGGDRWGAAAMNTDRKDYGGPAIIPTANQLLLLARDAPCAEKTVTYLEGMAGVPNSLLLTWESKTAQERRRRERDAAVQAEELRVGCETCDAGPEERCRTKTGRVAELSHTGRRRTAEANVDARIGWIGDNPVAVAGA
ncbi:hypothetical protein ABTX35_03545 [Streptomyces sp. NPDC096080]|uniref:zinc finger domain-containing protein n=1 Tax=Streptomyces sp. NPDC096080 TaxID=3156693 RepID=UPI00331BCD3F